MAGFANGNQSGHGMTRRAPVTIEHRVDTDFDPATGACSYHYNYLVYRFAHPLGRVTARSYLETPGEVSLLDQNRFNLTQVEKEFWSRLRALSKILGSDWISQIRFCSRDPALR